MRLEPVLAAAVLFAVLILCAPPVTAGTGPVEAEGVRLVTRGAEGPLAAACVFVGAGSAHEDEAVSGVTGVLNRLVVFANGPDGGPSAAVEIESLGGRIEVEDGFEYSCFTLTVPAKNLAGCLGVLGRAMAAPALDASALRAVKRRTAGGAAGSGTPAELGYRRMLDKSGPEGSYALDPGGGPARFRALTSKDVTEWHARHYVRGNVLVSVCADIGGDAARTMVAKAFRGLKDAGERKPAGTGKNNVPDAAGPGGVHVLGGGLSAALVGFSVPAAGSPGYAAVKVVEAAVAQGMGSMLFRELRVNDKLAYSFGSIMHPMRSGGRLMFYANADAACIDKAARVILDSVGRVAGGGLGGDELARARGLAAGTIALAGEGVVGKARAAGLAAMLGVDQDYWEELSSRITSVGRDDAAKAASKYMSGHDRSRPGPGVSRP